MRKKLKVSSHEFASLLGISSRSLYNKEHGLTPWYSSELIAIAEIMKANGIEEQLTVSLNGIKYNVSIVKVA